MLIGAATQLQAQAEQPATATQPMPKSTHVVYANGASPTLTQQIEREAKLLQQLKAIPAAQRSAYTRQRIEKLETSVATKRKQAKAQADKQPVRSEQ